VTVVICVYNAGDYFRHSLQSVLDQTYRSLEILVIDDGSTDGCIDTVSDLLQDPRVRLIRQENQGKSAALNRALESLKGEYYAIQDADDLSHPERMERLLECFLEDPSLGAVFSGHELILGDRCVAPTFRERGPEECRRMIESFRMPAHDPTVMYHVPKVRSLKYDTSLWLNEGFDYILQVGEKHPMRVLGKCLYSYRFHLESITKKTTAHQERAKFAYYVVEKACQRRGVPVPKEFEKKLKAAAQKPRNRDRDNNLAAHFMNSTVDLRRAGKRLEALRTAWICSRMHPLDFHYQKALIYALAPLWLVNRIRSED